jgi:3alpha(or 20beta)-hydroxysteroid dehydrogenase
MAGKMVVTGEASTTRGYEATMQLQGETAFIIGAMGEIGRATSLNLARQGARLILVDDDETTLAALGNALLAEGARSVAHVALSALSERTQEILGQAGAIGLAHFICPPPSARVSILEADVAMFDDGMSDGLGALFHSLRHILPFMVAQGRGTFVVSCSVAALAGDAAAAVPVATDHAILGLVRAAAMDVASAGVTVNAICHPFATGRRVGTIIAEQVADAAMFLHSPLARNITGSHFVVDAGQSARLAARADSGAI